MNKETPTYTSKGKKKNVYIKDRPLLGPRETEVLGLIRDKWKAEHIGVMLGISTRTVDSHSANIKRKFGVKNKKGMIMEGLRLKLI